LLPKSDAIEHGVAQQQLTVHIEATLADGTGLRNRLRTWLGGSAVVHETAYHRRSFYP
jgi:hypothetical protein